MNPYTEFVKTLTDAQLQVAYEIDHGSYDLAEAVAEEYVTRERSTKLTFYTPHIDEFRRLYVAEEGNKESFMAQLQVRLDEYRLLAGWSRELEAAFKILIIELGEQL